MKRRLTEKSTRRIRRNYKLTRCNHRDFRRPLFSSPELRWMDQLLLSFSEETPVDWVPAQYQSILDRDVWNKRKLS